MAGDRKSRQRLTKDSDWVRRLNDVVDKSARASVFRPYRNGNDGGNEEKPLAKASGTGRSQDKARAPATLENRTPPPRAEGWNALGEVRPQARNLRERGAPIVNFYRDGPVAKAFDLLRTRLVHTLRQNGWSRIAVAAPTRGAGATFTSVNLALSLARVPGTRTILMDLNQRAPGIAQALALTANGEMRHFLTGKVSLTDHLVRMGDTLALGLSTSQYTDSADLLHDRRIVETLDRMYDTLVPDTVLYDMPAILEYDDLGAFLPQIDGVLLISDGTATTARQIAECERVMEGQTQLLGVILNRARKPILGRMAG